MRPPNKSRSRNKNNRRNNNNSGGNVLNRVYDSAGPDGRVRGTPVQVIEKYQALAHDNSLAGDRVAMENFQQHAEHYIRLINEAQRQMAERREQMESQNQNQNRNSHEDSQNSNANRNPHSENHQNRPKEAQKPDLSKVEQPDLGQVKPEKNDKSVQPETSPMKADADVGESDKGGLVETPEGELAEPKATKPKRQRRPRQPANKVAKDEAHPTE